MTRGTCPRGCGGLVGYRGEPEGQTAFCWRCGWTDNGLSGKPPFAIGWQKKQYQDWAPEQLPVFRSWRDKADGGLPHRQEEERGGDS